MSEQIYQKKIFIEVNGKRKVINIQCVAESEQEAEEIFNRAVERKLKQLENEHSKR